LASGTILSRGQIPAWLLCLVVLFLLIVTACQRADVESTPTSTLPPPPTIDGQSGPESGYPPPTAVGPESTGYPVATERAEPTAAGYPPPNTDPTRTPRGASTPAPAPSASAVSYLPLIPSGNEPTAAATPTPTETATPVPTPTPTIDFSAVRAQLQAQGQDLGFSKMGFHTGVGGNRTGLGDWMQRLDAAGVPFFLKSADDSGPLVEAQEIVRNSDTPHTLVYRRSGNDYDTPNYDLPPEQSAREHWQRHIEAFPPELDPSLVWIETINEVDKERAEWLGRFALETARLAQADGFRWAAFGWSSGEPEVSDWQAPSMLEFLQLASANPESLAIALHEYSFKADDIAHEYPFKVGRFQQLFQVTDQLGIARPTVLITEWGWEYQNIPSPGQAMNDIRWAAAMYAPYPEIKGAAIWYLGGGFAEIAEQVQPLIWPVLHYNLGNYFAVALPPEVAPIDPERYRP
jgi:hypothetical protein